MAGSTLEQRGSKTMTTSTLSTEEAIVALKQHVEEFIVLELNKPAGGTDPTVGQTRRS